jgi:hypothetical protein
VAQRAPIFPMEMRACFSGRFEDFSRPFQPKSDLFMCHDYGPNGRDIRWNTIVGEERAHNVHVRDGVTEDEFAAMREMRDKTQTMPRLILPSLQVNIRAGHLPDVVTNPATGQSTLNSAQVDRT